MIPIDKNLLKIIDKHFDKIAKKTGTPKKDLVMTGQVISILGRLVKLHIYDKQELTMNAVTQEMIQYLGKVPSKCVEGQLPIILKKAQEDKLLIQKNKVITLTKEGVLIGYQHLILDDTIDQNRLAKNVMNVLKEDFNQYNIAG